MEMLPALEDRIVAGDPGLIRLLMAARATFAVGSALGLLLLIARAFSLPVSVPLLGAALGMTWSLAVSDTNPRDQRVTTVLIWFPAAAALAIGTETASNRILGDSLFVAVLFVSMYARRYGPRGYAAGMVSVLAFFFALFLRAAPAQLPWMLLAIAITALCTYVSRFVIFRDRPERALRNAASAFRARQRLAMRVIERAAQTGWTKRLSRRLNHEIFRLNETALTLDDILRGAADDERLRAAVLEAELSTAECAERARRNPDPTACAIAPLDLGDVGRLDGAAGWVPRGAFRAGTKPEMRLDATTRQAVQLTAAAIPAIVVGEMLSAQRWYWAVLAAFVVFGGTSSSGETLGKAWSRVLGTAVGVAGGVVLAYVVRGHTALAFVLLMLCLFAAIYAVRLSYAVMILFVTMLLALLYVIMGLFSDSLLVLRLIETAIGAALGGIAATLLLPIKTGTVLQSVTQEALQRLHDAVDACADRMNGKIDANPLAAARAYDEAFQSVRTQLRPLIAATRLGNTDRLRTRLLVLAACGYYVRALASLSYEEKTAERDAAALSFRARIDRAVERLALTIEPHPR